MNRLHQRGFTLIELMVAIAAMALLAIMSWRGLDGMVRAQSQTRERADAVLTLQTSLAQWGTDLDAVVELAQTRPIDWDGKTLRLTRRSSDPNSADVFVVAWTSDGTRWRRWQSPPVSLRADWLQAWNYAAAWAQGSSGNASSTGNGTEASLIPVQAWQLYYFRNDAWVPATSGDTTPSTGAAAAAVAGAGTTTSAVPDGLRLVLTLPPGPGLQGTLTRDWVRPSSTISKS
jgi:general secretion pathway protein J